MHASPLIAMLGEHKAQAPRRADAEANAEHYWKRSDAFDMVLDFRRSGEGRSRARPRDGALARAYAGARGRVSRRWIAIEDEDWFWFIGLDAEGTRIGNALWDGRSSTPARWSASSRCSALRAAGVREIAGRPIYLILAMTPRTDRAHEAAEPADRTAGRRERRSRMAEMEMMVGLVVDRIKLSGPWSDYAWMPAQVLLEVPEAAGMDRDDAECGARALLRGRVRAAAAFIVDGVLQG